MQVLELSVPGVVSAKGTEISAGIETSEEGS